MRGDVKDEIVALMRPDGKIYPQDIVRWAKAHKKSALYKEFLWDVEKAAMQHWLFQARQLISVHVVDDFGERQTVNLKVDWTYGGGYRTKQSVMSTTELRRAAVDQALEELPRWSARYEYLSELECVRNAIEDAILCYRRGGKKKAA